jgi:cellulose biosynthesis protein BcsQ
MERQQASICFFNNKGGVGKTTLACNVASYIAQHEGMSVLIIDADPQCNATQLVLPDEVTTEIYRSSNSQIDSLKTILDPIAAGDASLKGSVRPATPQTNRFGVNLLPGHPQVALLEDLFSSNWTGFIGGGLGGARVSNWNTQLLKTLKTQYDLIVYDVGPSLGALNRCVLIGVDYFIAPMGCDIFSLIGIENIANWLQRWQDNYAPAIERCQKDYPGQVEKFQIKTKPTQMSRFLGYTVQQYITKTIRAERRATGAYEAILKEIPNRIEESLVNLVADGLDPKALHLGDVPHMFSLVPLAQTSHAPIHGLTSADGLSGGQYAQQADYRKFIADLSKALLRNLRASKDGAK